MNWNCRVNVGVDALDDPCSKGMLNKSEIINIKDASNVFKLRFATYLNKLKKYLIVSKKVIEEYSV